MSAFQIAQRRRRGIRGHRNLLSSPQATEAPKETANPFGDDDDLSDDIPEPKSTRRVTTIKSSAPPPSSATSAPKSTAAPASGPKKPEHSAPKQSQIARLLKRQRDAQSAIGGADAHGMDRDKVLFRTQLHQCAEDSTTESYRSTPVDGFGETLLRAMGWSGHDEDEPPGKADDEDVKPRPDRLGLGATLKGDGSAPVPVRKRRRVDVSEHPLHGPAHGTGPDADEAGAVGIVVSSDSGRKGEGREHNNRPEDNVDERNSQRLRRPDSSRSPTREIV